MAVKIEIKGAKELAKAMYRRAVISEKSIHEIVNKAAKNVTFRALQFSKDTPAGRSKIAENLTDSRGMAYRMANKALNGKRMTRLLEIGVSGVAVKKKRRKRRGTGRRKRKSLLGITRAQINRKARNIIRRYQATSGYTRASLINDAQTFGGAQRSKIKLYDEAGRAASESDRTAVIVSGAPASTRVMSTPIERALDFVVKDMTEYTSKKLFKTLMG